MMQPEAEHDLMQVEAEHLNCAWGSEYYCCCLLGHQVMRVRRHPRHFRPRFFAAEGNKFAGTF
jgi:hypothetical protein